MILFDSLYVNTGGGKVLLDYLVQQLHRSGIDVFYLFDARCSDSYDYIPADKKLFMVASVMSRHKFYLKNRQRFSKVLCFGNVPPTTRLQVPVYTYFQNKVLIRRVTTHGFKLRWLLRLKSKFIRLNEKNTNFFIVQSESIKQELCNAYHLPEDRCLVIPFYREHTYTDTTKTSGQYLFVSEGYNHKNHLRLLEAWKIINQTRPELSLHLTVSGKYPVLQDKIQQLKDEGVNVTNHGIVGRERLHELYASSPYVIYPSLIESFGLGLIEGFEAGCEIIAAERPYARAVLEPYKTFDALSVPSIVETVLSSPPNNTSGKLVTQPKIKNEIKALLDIFASE